MLLTIIPAYSSIRIELKKKSEKLYIMAFFTEFLTPCPQKPRIEVPGSCFFFFLSRMRRRVKGGQGWLRQGSSGEPGGSCVASPEGWDARRMGLGGAVEGKGEPV